MAWRIVWTSTAKKQLKEVIDYWNKRNHSKSYSQKIRTNLKVMLKLICAYPEIGVRSTHPNALVKTFMRNFKIIYKLDKDRVVILNFWDTKQDPKTNKYL